MEHCKTSGDDAARFLDELRQLRDGAGLGHAELAARAHYPYDFIKAAEIGPSLPDLPVLSAFVRGCGGTTEEWEERWRSLTSTPSLPVPVTRQASQSDAADAGARVGATAPVLGAPDPSVIIAALNRVAEEMATPGADEVPVPALVAQSVPDFPPPAPLPAEQPGKPSGWDPIRVSSAWPALKHTPTVAKPAREAGAASGSGVPWDEAPWANDPVSSASSGAASVAADADAGPAGADGAATAAAGGSGRTAKTTIVVVAVVLLCVLVALLAVFA